MMHASATPIGGSASSSHLHAFAGSDDVHQSSSSSATTTKPTTTTAVSIDWTTVQQYTDMARQYLHTHGRLENVRSLSTFLGLQSTTTSSNNTTSNRQLSVCLQPTAFTPPIRTLDKATPEKLASRVKLNIHFFVANYLLVAALVAAIVALLHPSMLVSLAVVYGLQWLHSWLLRTHVEVFGIAVHRMLPPPQPRQWIIQGLTAVVIVWKCLGPLLVTLTTTAVLVAAHAVARDPKHVDAILTREEQQQYQQRHHHHGDIEGRSSEMAVLVDRPLKPHTSLP